MCSWLSFDVFHIVYKVIKSVNEWHTEADVRGFGTLDFTLFLFKYVDILGQSKNRSYNNRIFHLLISSIPNFE